MNRLGFIILFILVQFYGVRAHQSSTHTDIPPTINLIGVWNKVKVEMKDGSKAVAGELTDDMIMTFDGKNVAKMISIQTENMMSYTIEGDVLFLGNKDTFTVSKPSANELVITAVNSELPDYKLAKTTFVRAEFGLDNLIKQKYIYPNMRAGLEDTLYQMNRFVYPKLRAIDNDFNSAYGFAFESIEGKFRPNYNQDNRFRVRFTITKRGRVENIWIDQSTTPRLNDRLADAILAFDGRWLPATQNGQPVTTEVKFEFTYGQKYIGQAQNQEAEKEKANSYFENGIYLYKQNRFKEAIQNFDLCLAIDPQNVQAHFNKGASLISIKQNDDACKEWNYLYNELGQVWVEKYIKQYCPKGK
jgi:tetratricopeptide (TPR) repeat protein